MLNKYSLFLLIFSVSHFSYAGLIEEFCEQQEGQMHKWYKCPKSKLYLRTNTCEFKNSYNEVEFSNGCSGPTGKYGKVFFSSCIEHDLCYHHEPFTNGYSQEHCDKKFYKSLEKACREKAVNIKACLRRAKVFYYALRLAGKPAFHCENTYGRYEN